MEEPVLRLPDVTMPFELHTRTKLAYGTNSAKRHSRVSKKAVMEEPVLRLPDVTMPFELHTYASDFAIEGVLMQDGHPIAFESRKLNETEMKYTVQEKEMTE
nr:reverse transcriptase [Tanacetum cinerariifolium]